MFFHNIIKIFFSIIKFLVETVETVDSVTDSSCKYLNYFFVNGT